MVSLRVKIFVRNGALFTGMKTLIPRKSGQAVWKIFRPASGGINTPVKAEENYLN
jgi:hypothetical protein